MLLSKLRLVSISIVAMPVGLLCQDLRARLLGPRAFVDFFHKANQDKPLKLHEEWVAAMRRVQWLPWQNEIGDESCA